MNPFFRCAVLLPLLLSLLLAGAPANAKGPEYLFKVGTIAPEGSVWAQRFQEFAQEVSEKSNAAIGFRVYAGGVMGDDRAMYRKMKVGQLHGGGFTMTGIGEVVPDFRVMMVPFLFASYDEVDRVTEALWPQFKKAFADKDLVLLAFTEVGFLYAMSFQAIASVADLKAAKVWGPEGDPVSKYYLETAGVTPIPLAIPDVLTSLQTGLVNSVFNSYYGAIVLQWFTRIKFVTNIPFAYSYGAFVVDRKTYARLPAEQAAMLETTAQKHFARLLADTRKSNEDSLRVLQENGIKLVTAPPEAEAEFRQFREKTVHKLVGEAFSKEIYEETMSCLAKARTKQP